MVWLPDGEKSLMICLVVLTEYWRVTDGQHRVVIMTVCMCVGLDGSTSGLERERLINLFNAVDNNQIRIFLLSTR